VLGLGVGDASQRRFVGETGGEESGGGVLSGEGLPRFLGDVGGGVWGGTSEGGVDGAGGVSGALAKLSGSTLLHSAMR
jgi:hypothetical protein